MLSVNNVANLRFSQFITFDCKGRMNCFDTIGFL